MENYILSIGYIELINEIDDLINKLLYSSKEGYINLSSKKAICEANNYLKKFDNQICNLENKFSIENFKEIITKKRNHFKRKIEEKYIKELKVWAFQVFKKNLDNCLLKANIEKENSALYENYFLEGLQVIEWYGNLIHLSQKDCVQIKEKFKKEFINSINSKDEFLTQTEIETEPKTYLTIRNNIINNEDLFLKTDFDDLNLKLNQNDRQYFKFVKNELKSYRKNKIKDEIIMINSLLNKYAIKNDTYCLIKEIENDLIDFKKENKNIKDEDLIKLITRRIEIFKSKNFDNCEFFLNLVIS